jgi:hypothetical protein
LESVTSEATPVVQNINDVGVVTVNPQGSIMEDVELSATVADEDGTTTSTITYQWSESTDGVSFTAISGATSSTFTPLQAHVGDYLELYLTYVDDYGQSESYTVHFTGPVENSNDNPVGTVTITGTAIEDGSLTASNDITDEDGMGTITYTWSNGATGDTITLGQSDVGNTITVTAAYTDGFGASESVVSDATVAVVNVNDAPTGAVTITGTPIEDGVLTASNTIADEDGLGAFTYTWSTGATGDSITLGQSDVGSTITVTASYTDGQGTAETMDSAATSAVANVNDSPTGTVTITGTTQQGQDLTASNDLADEDGMGAITYTWSTGATGDTITLGQSDVGTTITVTATYTDQQGTAESVTSSATSSIDNGNDLPTGSVTITGTPIEDGTLTASNDIADADGLGTITYTWSNGATGDTITLGQSDVGTTLTVTAAYTDGYGASESVTSAATAAVTNVNDAPTGSVTITGTATED